MADPHPDTTTIPSDPTITIHAASQPEKAPRLPMSQNSLRRLRCLIVRSLSNAARSTDHNLVRLSELLSTPSGIDVLLCTTSYTLTLVHALLSRLLERKLAEIAVNIAEKAEGVLFPGETLIASLPASTSTKVLAQIVGSSKALAETIADYRIFVRLWGVVGLYTWARGLYREPLPKDANSKQKVLRGLTWAAIASCIAFQTLENGAYLSSKEALTTTAWTGSRGKAREMKWWIWSSRFWAAYVGIELVRIGVQGYYHPSNSTQVPETSDDGEKEDKVKREENIRAKKLENWLWWKDLTSNIAYAPMTIHWSLERGVLSDWGVGACGMVAGGSLLVDAWRKTSSG